MEFHALNRLYRKEAAAFIGCSTSTLSRLERMGMMGGRVEISGTFLLCSVVRFKTSGNLGF